MSRGTELWHTLRCFTAQQTKGTLSPMFRSARAWHSTHYIGRSTTGDVRTRSSGTDICAEHGPLLRAPCVASPNMMAVRTENSVGKEVQEKICLCNLPRNELACYLLNGGVPMACRGVLLLHCKMEPLYIPDQVRQSSRVVETAKECCLFFSFKSKRDVE